MNSGSTKNLSRHLNIHKDKINQDVNKQAIMLNNFLKSSKQHAVCK